MAGGGTYASLFFKGFSWAAGAAAGSSEEAGGAGEAGALLWVFEVFGPVPFDGGLFGGEVLFVGGGKKESADAGTLRFVA
jgi:hypothetical protein